MFLAYVNFTDTGEVFTGTGETLEEAFKDLKYNTPEPVDISDVQFFEEIAIRSEITLKIIKL